MPSGHRRVTFNSLLMPVTVIFGSYLTTGGSPSGERIQGVYSLPSEVENRRDERFRLNLFGPDETPFG